MAIHDKQGKVKEPKQPIERQAMGIAEFSKAEGFSRGLTYLMLADGTGPETYMVRGRRLITTEAARAWRERMIQATKKRGAGAA